MKKSLIFVGILAIGYANAQEGNVGINTDQPKATLDIQPNATNLAGTTNEGILAPRLSKTRIANIEASKLTEGTLVYATDDTTSPISAYAGTDTKVAKITEKGYYFYNGTEWVKTSSNAINEFIPTEIEDVYGVKKNGVKLATTFSGINENRTLFGISDEGGFYLESDDDARLQVFGNGKAELNVQTKDNASRGIVTVLGGSENYGQVYIGTRNNTTQEESLWSIQNVGAENPAPQVANRLGDLGIRLGTTQKVLFKTNGRVSIGSNETPKATLSLSLLGEKYKTSIGEDRFDALHLYESNNSAYGFGIHNATLEIYGNDTNNQVQIGKRASDGTGVFTPNVTFKGSGNVGIGTDNPTEKLEVDGKIKASSLAQTGAGDRVVYADENGVLKTGVANTGVKAGTTAETCSDANLGAIHFKEVEISGTSPVQKKGVFGFCTKQNDTAMWVYLSNGGNIMQGTGTFGQGL